MLARMDVALSIAGLPRGASQPWGDGTRTALAWASGLGYRYVHLDGTAPDARARDLSRSARRDLAATLRRDGLVAAAIDLWIPPEHFASPSHAQRAVDAVTAAVGLASDLALLADGTRVGVCTTLDPKTPADLVDTLAKDAAAKGVTLADHAWPPRGFGGLGVGIDPAAIFASGAEVVPVVTGLARAPAAARLSDLGPAGRVPPGDGRLDVLVYEGALSAVGYAGVLALDLRHLRDPGATARALAPTH